MMNDHLVFSGRIGNVKGGPESGQPKTQENSNEWHSDNWLVQHCVRA